MRAFSALTGFLNPSADARMLRAKLNMILSLAFYSALVNPLGVLAAFGPSMIQPETFGHLGWQRFAIAMGLHAASSFYAWRVYVSRLKAFDTYVMERRLCLLQIHLGLTWGATVWLLWVPGNPINHVFVSLVMISMLWAVTVTRAAHMRVYFCGFVSMGLMFWLRLLTGDTPAAQLLSAFFVVWILYVIFMGSSIRHTITELMRTRFANEDMTDALKAARDDAQFKRREAEEANRSKTSFLANMSHELRTPLNAILGFSDMIASETLGQEVPPRYREYAQDINHSGAHLLTLINDLLDVAKIEAGHMEIDPRLLDVADAIETSKRLLASRLAMKHQRLITDLEPDLPAVYADERAFKQIVLNLLSNAHKFTGEDGVITLSCHRAPEGGVVIVVEDNGIGITAAKLELIFRPFAQADNRYDRAAGGTGLGLSLVRGLAELHGGRVAIESTEGVGTRVSVYLPLSNTLTNETRRQA